MKQQIEQDTSLKRKESMRAAAIDRFGPPSVLKMHTLPIPKPGPNEIVIALHSAGVGGWDESVRDGSWKPNGRTKFPLVLGTDGAGKVVAKGARVRRFHVGDRAWSYEYANPKGGFYAEYVAVDANKAALVPRRLDLLHAGASATTGLTALQGIDDALRVRPGETVLIFGATGAVGTLAVQFAKRRRARVIGTASGRHAVKLLRSLGVDGVIDARSGKAVEHLRALAPDGIDAVLALAGGKELERCLDLVRKGGRVAYPNGIDPEPRHRRRLRTRSYDAMTGSNKLSRLGDAVNETHLRVPLAAVYPLAEAADAHRRQHQRVIGRIALRVKRQRE
jgi:NADPH:quinone reductase-like Zn-dependent oxidoreductase